MSQIEKDEVGFYLFLCLVCGVFFGLWQMNVFAGVFMAAAAVLVSCLAEVIA